MIRWPGSRARGGEGEKPVILFYNDFFGGPPTIPSSPCIGDCEFTTDRRDLPKAAAVIFHIPNRRPRMPVFKRRGQLWVAWSMESEVNYPRLADPAFMRRFDLTMTYKRSSDIWCPYLPPAAEFAQAISGPVPAKTADAPVVMFQSAKIDQSGRNAYAQELMEHIGVHSYGRVLNNRQLPAEDLGNVTKQAMIGAYKFCIGFENSIDVDYVTEKFFQPLLAGSVPVYLGAPNVADFAPGDHAYIDTSDFTGPRELAEYLVSLDRDDEAYARYFDWRKRGLSAEFEKLLSASSEEPFCRLCKIVAAHVAAMA